VAAVRIPLVSQKLEALEGAEDIESRGNLGGESCCFMLRPPLRAYIGAGTR
jgi:hypothetical protein